MIPTNKMFWLIKRDGVNCTMTCPSCGDWFVVPDIPGEAEHCGSCPSCGTVLAISKADLHNLYEINKHQLKCQVKCEYLEEQEDEDGSCGYCKMANGRFVGMTGDISRAQCECVAVMETKK